MKLMVVVLKLQKHIRKIHKAAAVVAAVDHVALVAAEAEVAAAIAVAVAAADAMAAAGVDLAAAADVEISVLVNPNEYL